jgi:hypothetical protein
MNATLAVLLGSLLGALAAVSGSVITNIVAIGNERRRQASQEETAYVQTLRERSCVAFGEFAKVVQAVEWVLWYAENDPNAINAERIDAYDKEVSGIYKDLVAAMAMTASLNIDVYEKLSSNLSDLYDLEGRVGNGIRKMTSDRTGAIELLRSYAAEAKAMRDQLPKQLHRILASTGAGAPKL